MANNPIQIEKQEKNILFLLFTKIQLLMKVFDFKKSILAVAAIAMSLTASAQNKTDIVESGYTPAGSAFSHEANIDWDKQKVVATIDLTTCGDNTSYENILSVGGAISEWNGNCFHLYYTKYSKKLQVNFCTSSGNPIRTDVSSISDTVKIEISKAEGITINGVAYNVKNGSTSADSLAAYAGLWALSTIQVGGCQGEVMSKATYNELSITNLAAEPVEKEDTVIVFDAYSTNSWYEKPEVEGTATVHLYRDLDLNQWSTIALPFDVALAEAKEQFGEDAKFGQITGVEDGVLQFASVTEDSLKMDVPYVIYPTKAAAVQVGDSAFYEFKKVAAFSEGEDYVDGIEIGEESVLVPTYMTASISAGMTYMKDGEFTTTTEQETIVDGFQGIIYPMDWDAPTSYRRWALDGVEITTPDPEPQPEPQPEPSDTIVLMKDIVADGTGFLFTHDIDWDKQYVKAVIDVTTCQRSTEDILSLGTTATDWTNNIHVYRKSTGYLTSFWDGNDGMGNNNTGEYTAENPVTIVVNKAEGLVVDGTVKIAAERMSGLYDLTTIAIGSGEGSNQQSYATYKSLEIITDDTATGIETLDSETKTSFNVYGINGQLLKSGTTDLNGLSHGIYVVNGKKVLK